MLTLYKYASIDVNKCIETDFIELLPQFPGNVHTSHLLLCLIIIICDVKRRHEFPNCVCVVIVVISTIT